MSVYVDNARIPYKHMKMCHMIADTADELRAMMIAIGVDPKHVQHAGTPNEHADVCLQMRGRAIEAGAIPVTTRELVKRMRKPDLARDAPTGEPLTPKDGPGVR